MAINKVVINNSVKLDLTEDTVTPETLKSGVTAHNAAGEAIVGTMSSGPSISYKQVNIGTEWTEGDDLWYQDISVDGLLASDHITVDILLSDDIDDANDELDNYDLIFRIQNLDGKVRIYSVEETYIALNFMLEIKTGITMPVTPTKTNLILESKDASGASFGTNGIKAKTRLNSSGAESTSSLSNFPNSGVTGYMPITYGQVIEFESCNIPADRLSAAGASVSYCAFYDENHNVITSQYLSAYYSNGYLTLDENNYAKTLNTGLKTSPYNLTNAKYFRVSSCDFSGSPAIYAE